MSEPTYFEQAERWFGNTPFEDSAQVMATLAIAEQLKRIADALEKLTGAPVAEGIVNPEDNEEFFAERKRAQEFLAGTRRGMGLEE